MRIKPFTQKNGRRLTTSQAFELFIAVPFSSTAKGKLRLRWLDLRLLLLKFPFLNVLTVYKH